MKHDVGLFTSYYSVIPAVGCGLPLCQFLASLSSAEILLLVRLHSGVFMRRLCFIHLADEQECGRAAGVTEIACQLLLK